MGLPWRPLEMTPIAEQCIARGPLTARSIGLFAAASRSSILSPRYQRNVLEFIRPESRSHVRRIEPQRPDPRGDHESRLHDGDADPGPHHPPAARRPRLARPGPDRHRQDRRLRHPHAPGDRPREETTPSPGPDAHPRAGHPGRPGVQAIRRRHAGPAGRPDLRRPGLPGPVPAARSRRPRRRRHAGPRHGPHQPRLAQARRRSAAWSWTRPTRCSRWASPRTSTGSSPRPRPSGRSRCSRPPCPTRSAGSPSAT